MRHGAAGGGSGKDRKAARLKASGAPLAEQVRHLERRLERVAVSLGEAEEAVALSRAREAVLCSLINNQEVLMALLKRLQERTETRSGRLAALPRHMEQRLSYVTGLVAHATPAQLDRAAAMGAAEWSSYKHDHFLRCVTLLELVTRPGVREAGAGAHVADGGAMARALRAAQGGADPDALLADDGAALDLASCFHAVMDEGLTLSFLCLLSNHLGIMTASLNADLPAPAAPPGHWLQVMRRMRLTDQQLLLLSLAADEFERMNARAAEDGARLTELAARPSLLLAGERRRAEAAAAAAAEPEASARPDSSHVPSSCPEETCAPAAARRGGAAAAPRGPHDGSGSSPSSTRVTLPPPSAARAAAASEQGGGCSPPRAASSAAALALGDGPVGAAELDAALLRHTRLRFLHLIMVGVFFFDTVTRVQNARMVVSCYPFYPNAVSLVCAAAELLQQRGVTRAAAAVAVAAAPAAAPEPRQACSAGGGDGADGSDCAGEGEEGYAAAQLREHEAARRRQMRQLQHWWQQHIDKHAGSAGTALPATSAPSP